MGKGIMKSFVALGSKMKINVDPFIGRPINGDESAKLASQIGVVTRDVLPVPKRWKDVDEEKSLEPGFDHINVYIETNNFFIISIYFSRHLKYANMICRSTWMLMLMLQE